MDFVDNQIDPASGVIRQRAVIENPDNFLTPGMFGHLRLLGSGAYAALLIPDAAISSDLNQRVVLILGPNSVLREKAVTVGPLFRGLRVVRSGVGPDDLVVVDTLVRARPGLKITPNRTTITPGPEVPVNPSAPGYINPVPTAASPAADAPTVR
jgi:multidrug efflux pump subunit AcrA (membrane-fusion protein)